MISETRVYGSFIIDFNKSRTGTKEFEETQMLIQIERLHDNTESIIIWCCIFIFQLPKEILKLMKNPKRLMLTKDIYHWRDENFSISISP